MKWLAVSLVLLVGCSSPRPGGYYKDDGPPDRPPSDLERVADAVPRAEPLHKFANRPYTAFGREYVPMTSLQPFRQRGLASWYGKRYHGQKTSSGETYDMYAMTAAHPTLPIPSYARVTNVATGKSVVVRINDRGPFLSGRLIDLSYTAAYRLGVLGGGSALVDVETIIPDGLPPGSAYAAAPPARARIAAAQTASAQRSATPAPNPYEGQADPILAIAAAARDAETPSPPASVVPTPPPRIASAAPPLLPEPPGVYLQLGAFGSRENAEGYLERARVQFEWLAERLQVRTREGLFRVHAGPYSNPNDARQAADRIA